MYDVNGKLKENIAMDIGTMSKLVEFYNAKNPSRHIRIVSVNESGEMKLEHKSNKLLKGFTYVQYQALLAKGFPKIAENKKQYLLSSDELEIFSQTQTRSVVSLK